MTTDRDIDPLLADEIKKKRFMPLFLVEFIFDSGPVRLWTGIGDVNVFKTVADITDSFSFDSSTKTINSSSFDFTTANFAVGQRLFTTETHNLGPFTITAVSASSLTVAETVVTESAGTVELTAQNKTPFTGSGNLLSVSDMEETQNLEANGVTFNLTGVNDEIISLAMTERYNGRVCRVFFGARDLNKNLIGAPYLLFQGFMDVMELTDSATTAAIALTVESKLIQLEKAKEFRYTPEDQKIYYPDDKGLDFIPSLQNKEIIWGQKTPS